MIRQLRERGLGVLITDHQVRETLAIVDRSYILNNGKIIAEGDAEHVLASELARSASISVKNYDCSGTLAVAR